jgi:hypothetical protein
MPFCSSPKQSIPGNPLAAERNASARSTVALQSASPSSASCLTPSSIDARIGYEKDVLTNPSSLMCA